MAIGHTVAAGTTPGSAVWSYFGNPVNGGLKEERYTSVKQTRINGHPLRELDALLPWNWTRNPAKLAA